MKPDFHPAAEPVLNRRNLLRRTFSITAAAAAVSIVGTGCSRRDAAANGDGGALDGLRERGLVRAGFANEAPYAFTDASGKLTGAYPELARAVFPELGIPEVEGVQVEWDGLIPGLTGGNYDIVAAGMAILPERCELVAFTGPEYLSQTAFLVPNGNPRNIARFEDIANNQDVVLGVLNASIEQEYAEKLGVPQNQIETGRNNPSLYELLQTGRVDAVALTSIALAWLQEQQGGPFEVTEPFFVEIDGSEEVAGGGYALRQTDADLVEEINRVVNDMKESGKLLEIIEPFGFTEDVIARDLTAEQLCQAG